MTKSIIVDGSSYLNGLTQFSGWRALFKNNTTLNPSLLDTLIDTSASTSYTIDLTSNNWKISRFNINGAAITLTDDTSVASSLRTAASIDTLILQGTGTHTVSLNNLFVNSYTGGSGSDNLILGAAGAGAIDLGDGNNSIVTGTGSVTSIRAGNGNNTIDLNGWVGNVITGKGNDTFIIESTVGAGKGTVWLHGGNGTDTFIYKPQLDPNTHVYLDDGWPTANATLDLSNFTTSLKLSLAGNWQNTGHGYVILYGVHGLIGGSANDVFTFNDHGNNTVDAGAGFDIGNFSGAWSSYAITVNNLSTGDFRVKDNRAGTPDGNDLLHNFELLHFTDTSTISTANFSSNLDLLQGLYNSGAVGTVTLVTSNTTSLVSDNTANITLASAQLLSDVSLLSHLSNSNYTLTLTDTITGSQVGALTPNEINHLSLSTISGLTADGLSGLSVSLIHAMSVQQIETLTTTQRSELTNQQITAMGGCTNLINGRGGADTLNGSSGNDFFIMDGYQNNYDPNMGMQVDPTGTVANGNGGNDVYWYYTNHDYFGNASIWKAPVTTINGGAGNNTVFVHGESIGAVHEWDFTQITMTNVQTLVLGWDPPSSNLQIDLTHQQWAGLSNIFIFPLNTNQNLTISVDGHALTNTLSKVHAVGTDLPYWYNLDPYFDPNVNIMIGTSANQTITAPV
jgi:hypothetical protein